MRKKIILLSAGIVVFSGLFLTNTSLAQGGLPLPQKNMNLPPLNLSQLTSSAGKKICDTCQEDTECESGFCAVTCLDQNCTEKIGYCQEPGNIVVCPGTKAGSISELITKLINWTLYLSYAIVPLMIVISGAVFMFSGGNPEKISLAKKIILWTLVGFGVILFSKGIESIVKRLIF